MGKIVGLIFEEEVQEKEREKLSCPHCGKEHKSESALKAHCKKEHPDVFDDDGEAVGLDMQ